MYIYGNTQSAFTTELFDGCLQNFVGMKNSWVRACVRRFCQTNPGADPGRGKNRARGGGGSPLLQKTSYSDWKATGTNRMHI